MALEERVQELEGICKYLQVQIDAMVPSLDGVNKLAPVFKMIAERAHER